MKMKRMTTGLIAALAAVSTLAGCSATTPTGPSGAASNAAPGSVKIDLWTPQAGSPKVEVENMKAMLDAFTATNPQYAFNYKTYPFDGYKTAVQGAATAGKLPCMLAVDAPNAPSWAWSQWLTPLQVPATVTDKLIPGAKGVWNDATYSVGYWDAGLAMFARKSALEAHKLRIPTVAQPWTAQEFDAALAALKTDKTFKYPLNLGTPDIYSGTPFLWSFGGDLIDRNGYQSAQGVLNGTQSVSWGTWLQSLLAKKYISASAADGNPFEKGDVPLSWDGNWDAQSSVAKFGDDVVFLPPPDMGSGVFVGAGSFGYGTSASCSDAQREGVNKFLEFSLSTDNLVKISDSQLVIPATAEAAAKSKNYGPSGQFAVFADLVANHSKIRPATPAFAVVSDIFNKAAKDIMAGGDVKTTLDAAAKAIDDDISQNDGYKG